MASLPRPLAGEGWGEGSPPIPCSMAMTEPLRTLSPIFTNTCCTVPACDEGISIDALSLSTVIKLCSTFTLSPVLTKTSMTATSSKSPMSGTSMLIGACADCALAAAMGASGIGAALFSGGDASGAGGAAPVDSSINTSDPWLTLSPSLALSSFTTPAWVDGISIDALSLSTVSRLWSTATVSPGLTRTSMTSTSLKSPMSGTLTSTIAMGFAPRLF